MWLGLSILAVRVAVAQEGNGTGFYGYSSIDYDPTSNTVTVYSETDLDPDLETYYYPLLSVIFTDNTGAEYGGTGDYGGDYVTYVNYLAAISAVAGRTYNISARHTAGMRIYNVVPDIIDRPNCEVAGSTCPASLWYTNHLSGP